MLRVAPHFSEAPHLTRIVWEHSAVQITPHAATGYFTKKVHHGIERLLVGNSNEKACLNVSFRSSSGEELVSAILESSKTRAVARRSVQ